MITTFKALAMLAVELVAFILWMATVCTVCTIGWDLYNGMVLV